MYDIKNDRWINLKGVTDNHSKHRGRCDRAQCHCCRVHPVNKALKRAKGAMKHNNESYNYDDFVVAQEEYHLDDM